MGLRPTLEMKLAELANRFRFLGISFMAIAAVAFLFSRQDPRWPFDPLSVFLATLFVAGSTLLLCGQLVVRKLVGFGSMEPPPITIPQAKG